MFCHWKTIQPALELYWSWANIGLSNNTSNLSKINPGQTDNYSPWTNCSGMNDLGWAEAGIKARRDLMFRFPDAWFCGTPTWFWLGCEHNPNQFIQACWNAHQSADINSSCSAYPSMSLQNLHYRQEQQAQTRSLLNKHLPRSDIYTVYIYVNTMLTPGALPEQGEIPDEVKWPWSWTQATATAAN